MNDQQRASRQAMEALRARSQRIRVGMIGLFGILVIVGLATAMLSRLTQQVDDAQARAQPAATQAVEAPVEPLTELGVAPEVAPANQN